MVPFSADLDNATKNRLPAVAAAGYARCQTTLPPTTVATGAPRKVRLWKGELRLLDCERFTS